MIIITEEYLRVITPIILDNKMVIIAISFPVIEVLSDKFDDAEYVILN